MIDTLTPNWTWGDEYSVLSRLAPECLDRYVNTSLQRHKDFRGLPVTAEWEATFLEMAAKAKAARTTWRGLAGRDVRARVGA